MTSPGLDLLLRVVGAQLDGMRCPACGRDLGGAPVALREHRADSVVVEVTCEGCRRAVPVAVKPEADGGAARLD